MSTTSITPLKKEKFSEQENVLPTLKVVRNDLETQKAERLNYLNTLALNSLQKKDYLVIVGTFLLMVLSIGFFIKFQPELEKLHLERMSTWWGASINYIAIGLLVIQLLFLTYLIILYTRYKVVKSVSNDLLPTCTVIVPAYNEGKLVYETLMSLAESDYPQNKLQILSIDDGSKDDTWQWMLKA